MIIQPKKDPDIITFSALEEGSAFRTVDSDRNILWMKIRNIITEFDCYNAVNLSNGVVESFDDFELITSVKVIVVEE